MKEADIASVTLIGLVRAQGCKNRPAPFSGRMSYKATKPGLAMSIVYLNVLLCSLFKWQFDDYVCGSVSLNNYEFLHNSAVRYYYK